MSADNTALVDIRTSIAGFSRGKTLRNRVTSWMLAAAHTQAHKKGAAPSRTLSPPPLILYTIYCMDSTAMKLLRRIDSVVVRRSDDERRANPSVTDYDTTAALSRALGDEKTTTKPTSRRPRDAASSASASSRASKGSQKRRGSATTASSTFSDASSSHTDAAAAVDWKLATFDPQTTNVQTMQEELERLQVLQSYFILDSDRAADFDRITSLAKKIFHLPIAAISLVDLGRQWFLSSQGLDVRETPRKLSFCAHVVQGKSNGVLVVPDATKDARFRDNALVTGPLNIRFYAGAPLLSPEGYKLGSFCIIDPVARPRGLSAAEQAVLVDLAAMAMQAMVERRVKLYAQHDATVEILSRTCSDVMESLVDTEVSLSSLAMDEHVKTVLSDGEFGALSSAASNIDLKVRMCRSTLRTIYGKDDSSVVPSTNEWAEDIAESLERIVDPVTDTRELVRSLNLFVGPLPKKVPLTIEIDPAVPAQIMGEDLLLFRSAVHVLCNSAVRTEVGSIHLRIKVRKGMLYFECEDTGPPYLARQDGREKIRRSTQSMLAPMANMMRTMGGDYGVRSKSNGHSSSVWFSVPIALPTAAQRHHGGGNEATVEDVPAITVHPASGAIPPTAAAKPVKVNGNGVSKDPFQAAILASGRIQVKEKIKPAVEETKFVSS